MTGALGLQTEGSDGMQPGDGRSGASSGIGQTFETCIFVSSSRS